MTATPTPAFARARPVVFVIHGGAYVFGGRSAYDDPFVSLVATQAAQFRRHGVSAIRVPYKAGDPALATRQVERFVRRHTRGRAAYALGTSSGGGLAMSLANAGLVRAAAGLSAWVDLRNWPPRSTGALNWTRAARLAASPILGRARVPLLLEHARDDGTVPYRQAVGFARSHPSATLITDRTGGHLPGWRAHHETWPRGFAWLMREIRRRR